MSVRKEKDCVLPNSYTQFLSLNRNSPWTNKLNYKKLKQNNELIDNDSARKYMQAALDDARKLEAVYKSKHIHDWEDQLLNLRNLGWVRTGTVLDDKSIDRLCVIGNSMNLCYNTLLQDKFNYGIRDLMQNTALCPDHFAECRNNNGQMDVIVPMFRRLFNTYQHDWLISLARPYLESLSKDHTKLLRHIMQSDDEIKEVRDRARSILRLEPQRQATVTSAGLFMCLPKTRAHIWKQTKNITADPLNLVVLIAMNDINQDNAPIELVSMSPYNIYNDGERITDQANKSKAVVTKLTMKRGEIVLFDPRITHRVGANHTDERRDMVYINLSVQDLASDGLYTHWQSVKTQAQHAGKRLLPDLIQPYQR